MIIKDKKINYKFIVKITIIGFIISFILTFISEITLPKLNVFLGILIVFIFIILGILFDMIGVAVTASDEAVFHSMNSKKIKSAHLAVLLKKQASSVASFCNDVIGDICGIISGSAGVAIAINLSNTFNFNLLLITLLVTALIAALTIGGKAIGKTLAMNKADIILYEFSKILNIFYKK